VIDDFTNRHGEVEGEVREVMRGVMIGTGDDRVGEGGGEIDIDEDGCERTGGGEGEVEDEEVDGVVVLGGREEDGREDEEDETTEA
jgi:hypothetical protein